VLGLRRHARSVTLLNRRWTLLLTVAAVAIAAAALAFQLALHRLHGGIEAALGPHATLQAVTLGWTGVELRSLRVSAAQAGPMPRTAGPPLRR
jgi:hypothetical protein